MRNDKKHVFLANDNNPSLAVSNSHYRSKASIYFLNKKFGFKIIKLIFMLSKCVNNIKKKEEIIESIRENRKIL